MIRARLSHESRAALLALAGGAPAVVVSLLLVWLGDYPLRIPVTVTLTVAVCWFGAALAIREHVAYPLRTLANLAAALREGDYSLRGGTQRYTNDSLGEVFSELNSLAELLENQRLTALDATTLLRAVMAQIDVAVFTFDYQLCLRLVNRAGERLLNKPAERLLGRKADELGLEDCLSGEARRTIERTFPGGAGRWSIRFSGFRELGLPHQLLLVEDLTRTLREEELQAWKRLVRVLGHELNNSLAPIRSIASSLETILRRDPPPADWKEDCHQGLAVIVNRADALSRFMEAYARLAKLPPPRRQTLAVAPWVGRIVQLETRLAVDIEPGPEAEIPGDSDQLDQMLINLLRNAVDAAAPVQGKVRVGWRRSGGFVEIRILDGGPGISSTQNLFVPFFTTKPGGSGIGLVLSRQIAEAHGGMLTLENRLEGGCEARVSLPASE
jgi:nitrogen fixation/metabolism regulation signal transduction histidine kinase